MSTDTAKSKAYSLVEKYMPLVEIHHFDGINADHEPMYSYSEIISKSNAKACAIIAVDLIIDEIQYIADEICMPLTDREIKRIEHYKEIKASIESM